MYITEHHCATTRNQATPENLKKFTLLLVEAKKRPQRAVLVACELAGWLQARAPGLWAEAVAQLAAEWPGRLHPMTEAQLTFWLALHRAGLLPAERLRDWAAPFVELERLRAVYLESGKRYHVPSPGTSYDKWKALCRENRFDRWPDELSERIRARGSGLARGCGLEHQRQRVSTRGSGSSDPRASAPAWRVASIAIAKRRAAQNRRRAAL